MANIITFIAGLILEGLAAAIVTQAGLGAPPIATLAYITTFLVPLSYGTLFFCLNVFFVILQFFILGKDFRLSNFLQILPSFIVCAFVDIGMILTEQFRTTNYLGQLFMLTIGAFTFAIGIILVIKSKITVVPYDGVVRAISYKSNYSLGKIKTFVDMFGCTIAVILSLITFHSLVGVREGTVIVAVITGIFIELIYKFCNKLAVLHKK